MTDQNMNPLAAFDQLKADVTLACQPVLDVKIDSQADQNKALQTASGMRDLEKRIEAKRKELVAPLNKRMREINAYAKDIQKPIGEATVHLKNQLGLWERKLEEMRRIEREKLEAERRDRERIERQREQERLKAEREEAERERAELLMRQREERARIAAQKKAEEEANELFGASSNGNVHNEAAAEEAARQAQEAEKRQFEEQLERRRLADAARRQREKEEAEKEAKERAKEIDALRVKNTVRTWQFEVIDPMKVPSQYCVPDPKLIRKAVKEGAREIPGVRIYEDLQVRIRG